MDIDVTLRGRHFKAAPSAPQDVFWVASNLREEDRLELERWYEMSPLEVIRMSLASSTMAWTAYRTDGMPVAIWGVAMASGLYQTGVPWMVGTPFINESLGDFYRFSKYYDEIMGRYYRELFNYVDASYTGALRWLERLGYSSKKEVTSIKNYKFLLMHKDTANVR